MGIIYALNANEYEPISYGDNYLYQQYDKLDSFLTRNYDIHYRTVLARPVLSSGVVNLHGNFDVQLSRIGDLNKDVQLSIKKEYWTLKESLEKDIQNLEYSSNNEKRKWGNLLRQVFSDEDNIILSDGENWCLLWGWKFKNKKENYLAPEFLVAEEKKLIEENEIEEIVDSEPAEELRSVVPIESEAKFKRSSKNHFWYKVKRYFRSFVYRYWGVLLFILLLLFLLCFLEHLNKVECPEIIQLESQLEDLNQKVNERCQEQP